jgi:AMP deaminase
VHAGPLSSYSFKRLELLAARFNLHVLLNDTRELEAQKSVPHRDIYNIRKVDTRKIFFFPPPSHFPLLSPRYVSSSDVHHSACMNQKHFLRFIKSKLKSSTDEAVIFRDGRFLTLGLCTPT